MKVWKAESLLFCVTFIWGATFLFTKMGLNDCQPSFYILMRFIIALILCFVFFGKHLLKMKKDIVPQGLILGLLFGGGFLLQTYGIKYTSVSKAAFITGIVVTITPFVYWLVDRKKISKWSIAGVVVASAGLYIFTNPQFNNLNPGDVMTLVSVFFWGFYISYMDIFTRNRKTFAETAQMVVLQYLAAAPMAAIAFFLLEYKTFYINFTPNLWLSLGFNAIMASFVVTFIHTAIQKFSNPVKAALIFSLEPVIASILAFMFAGEVLSGRELTGGIILFVGVLISEIFPMMFKPKVKNEVIENK